MRFRTVVIAAAVLALCATGAFAAYQIGGDARGEAAQQTVERTDSLAVEPDIRQKLVSDQDHDPTQYGDSVAVTYNGTEWAEGDDYEYHQQAGEIEFLNDENASATIEYQYDVPADQAGDEQLQTATRGFGLVLQAAIGLSFVVLLLFIGGFVARRMGVGQRSSRGR